MIWMIKTWTLLVFHNLSYIYIYYIVSYIIFHILLYKQHSNINFKIHPGVFGSPSVCWMMQVGPVPWTSKARHLSHLGRPCVRDSNGSNHTSLAMSGISEPPRARSSFGNMLWDSVVLNVLKVWSLLDPFSIF